MTGDTTLTVGSLFAGVGGFDLAAERAGMEILWQSEYDRHASQVLEDHWLEVPNYGDIRKITMDPDQIGAAHDATRVDVLVGGFPCQDYSVAGLRGGLVGDRGALWWEFHRLIAEGRPRWVIGENVPGILSSRGGRDFATIIDSLTELGYGVVWRVLDAQYFGVAQRRRRVFIVGHSGGRPRPEVLALAEGLSGHPAPSRKAGTVVTAITRSGVGGGGGADDNSAQANHLLAEGLVVRRLTPLEVERLQGFPDGWTASQSDSQRYRQMGNAVAVPVAEWVMRRIADTERSVDGVQERL